MAGVTPTLLEDTEVRVKTAGHRLTVKGTLLSHGSADRRVVFGVHHVDGALQSWKGSLFTSNAGASDLIYTTILNAEVDDIGVLVGN
ncbi:MAG: hypothetical protein M2R46_05612 [Verrucomicrobia subdivision 3 bacterium]|nr:hypothetical protein [Limisphaerales bacterium]